MGDFQITVVNRTGDEGAKPTHVRVMLFQTVPDPLITKSYSTAWKVDDVPYPGSVGPIVLPEKCELYVIDRPGGDERKTGPFQVSFGDQLEVTQIKADDAPTVKKVDSDQPKHEIKVTNLKGNAQKLEIALFKNGSKLVSFKQVRADNSAYLAIEPAIYIANIESIVEGEDFEAVAQSAKATKIQLYAGKPKVEIQITQTAKGELGFSSTN